MHIQETYIDTERNLRIGESDIHEAYTEDTGELFRRLRQEYGRCRGKVYVDLANEEIKSVGWVFEQKVQYSDHPSSYLRETWITLYDKHICSECGRPVYKRHFI